MTKELGCSRVEIPLRIVAHSKEGHNLPQDLAELMGIVCLSMQLFQMTVIQLSTLKLLIAKEDNKNYLYYCFVIQSKMPLFTIMTLCSTSEKYY